MSELAERVEAAIMAHEREMGAPATRARDMLRQHGEVETVSRLMLSDVLQTGLRALAKAGQGAATFEQIVMDMPDLFSPDVREAAAWRLRTATELG